MCGIAGIVARGRVHEAVLHRMGDALAHRGPDGAGVHLAAPFLASGDEWQAGLSHRRLAVFDPTPAGAQPMTSRSGRFTLALNGEIFNHPELRRHLAAFPWRSRTDSEVLLELLEARGLQILSQLNGMFAFAAWDARERRLWLARDRLGVKPLYYRAGPEALVFASELSALTHGPQFERRMDPDALSSYLDFGFVPAPATMLAGVAKLPPGTLLEWQAGRVRVERWWRLPEPPSSPDPGWREALHAALVDSVRLRLRGDVPVGTLLSGGFDSTLVSALAARQRAELKTFSVHFPESPLLDESRFARAASRWLGTRHVEVAVRGTDLGRELPRVLARLDEPFADGSLLPLHLLSQRARQQVTVALSGDGADELFAGYRRYTFDAWLGRWQRLPRPAQRALGRWIERLGDDRTTRLGELGRRAKKVLDAADLPPEARALAMARIFREGEKAHLLTPARRGRPEPSLDLLRRRWATERGRDPLDTQLRVDLGLLLPDDMLTKVDRASMACGLEVRVPFLDHRVVELAAALPTRWKLRGHRSKRALREVFERQLPPLVRRRGKAGFDAPLTLWLRGPLRPLLRDTLAAPALEQEELLDAKFVATLLDEHDAGLADHAWRLWSLLVLCDWKRRHAVA